MKTAEEIMKDFDFTTTDDYNPVFERMKNAINEARKEAIEECAEKAEQICSRFNLIIDKKEILSLINKLQ